MAVAVTLDMGHRDDVFEAEAKTDVRRTGPRPPALFSHQASAQVSAASGLEHRQVAVVSSEPEIDEISFAARLVCRQVGMDRATSRRLTRIVESLVRGLCRDDHTAHLSIAPLQGPLAGIRVTAVDDGLELGDITALLAGRPTSLAGWSVYTAAKGADHFQIEPGPHGNHLCFIVFA